MRLRLPPAVLAAPALALVASPAGSLLAAELYADGRLRQSFEYDDNIDLTSDGEDAFGSRTGVGVTLGARTPATDLSLSSDFRLVRFFTDSDLDSEDVDVDALGRWLWPRTSLSLGAGVTRDTTRELLDTETGLLAAENEERLTVRANSSLSHSFTPLQSGGLSLSYSKRLYPTLDAAELAALDLDEWDFYRANANWALRLSPTLSLTSLVGGSYFDSDREETTTVQTRLGANYGLTPALSLSGSIGPSVAFTSSDEPGADSGTELGVVWNADLNYRPSKDTALSLGVFQEYDPGTAGELNLRSGLSVNLNYELTRYTSFSLPALIQRQEPVERVTATRYFARVQPTLGFQVLPQVRLETSYRFRWEGFEGGDTDDAYSNAVFLSASYALPSFFTSR